jgi:hypothetical protein
MNMPIVPTSARWMNDAEWEIVTRVFTPAELPFRAQILVTNGQGSGNSPNTGNMSILSGNTRTAWTSPCPRVTWEAAQRHDRMVRRTLHRLDARGCH